MCLVSHLCWVLGNTTLSDLLDISSTHHWRFGRDLAGERSLLNLLHVYGYFAWKDRSCRWGRKNVDLVPHTGLCRRRTVGSFDSLGLVRLITLLLLRLGISLLLRSILGTLSWGSCVGVGRLLAWLVHRNRLRASSI